MAKKKIKKIMSPIDITINREEFRRAAQQMDIQAAAAMRLFAGFGIDPRCTPQSVEKFLKKKGL